MNAGITGDIAYIAAASPPDTSLGPPREAEEARSWLMGLGRPAHGPNGPTRDGRAAAALAGRLILPGHGFTPAHGYASLTSATDFRAALGAVSYLTLIVLLSLGLAAAVRDSASSPSGPSAHFSSARSS